MEDYSDDKLLVIYFSWPNNGMGGIVKRMAFQELLRRAKHSTKTAETINSAVDAVLKPPIGIIPESVWIINRMKDLSLAINRYIDADMKVPLDWINEYNTHVDELRRIGK